MLRPLMLIVGGIAMVLGLFWLSQGLALIGWPASSVMIGQPAWARFGGLLAVMGVVVLWLSRKPPA